MLEPTNDRNRPLRGFKHDGALFGIAFYHLRTSSGALTATEHSRILRQKLHRISDPLAMALAILALTPTLMLLPTAEECSA